MEIGEGVAVAAATTKSTKTVVHAALQVKSVTFSSNHPVERDTLGTFSAPEWLRGRRRQWPVCYTRGARVGLTACFEVVMAPSATESVSIRGRAQVGSATLEWSGSVSASPSASEVRTASMTSSAALPNHVAYFRRVTIVWQAQPPGESWSSAGSSNHLLYLTLGSPQGTPCYWTLVDISCRGADGASTAADLVRRAYSQFPSRHLRRKRDGRRLAYWNPATTRATDTQQLLARGDGSGQCGSWSELLIDMYKVHGVASADKVLVVVSLPAWQSSSNGFLVKNWRFIGTGSSPPPYTHSMGTECVELPGIPGQGNPNPPPAFYNHFIVRCLGDFYDPSYGGGPIGGQPVWENGAIDGLFRGGLAGYPKSSHSSSNLLQFWDLTTRTRI